MKKRFTIIMTFYNVADLMRRGLDSVLAAAGKYNGPVELICVDDGSPDNAGAILDEYAMRDSRVKVIHQRNTGISIARQKGLDAASGDWVLFADPDDYVSEDFVCDFAEAIEKHPSVDMVWSDYYRKTGDEIVRVSNITSYDPKEHIRAIIAEEIMAVVWTRAFRRQFILDHGIRFFEKRHNGLDDFYFVIVMMLAGPRIVHFDACNYTYVYNPTSITGSGIDAEKFGFRVDVYSSIYRKLKGLGYEDELQRIMQRELFWAMLNSRIPTRDFLQAFSFVTRIDSKALSPRHCMMVSIARHGGRGMMLYVVSLYAKMRKAWRR